MKKFIKSDVFPFLGIALLPILLGVAFILPVINGEKTDDNSIFVGISLGVLMFAVGIVLIITLVIDYINDNKNKKQ